MISKILVSFVVMLVLLHLSTHQEAVYIQKIKSQTEPTKVLKHFYTWRHYQ
ncbi:MAG: hypothetical protein H6Q19_355 [Bacteroidetes bacterium]|nr:hypothetical protein [Bacteroidota bacterium]